GRGDELRDGGGQAKTDGGSVQRNGMNGGDARVRRQRQWSCRATAVEQAILEVRGERAHNRERIHLAARRQPCLDGEVERELGEACQDEGGAVRGGQLGASGGERRRRDEGLPVQGWCDARTVAEVRFEVRQGFDERLVPVLTARGM